MKYKKYPDPGYKLLLEAPILGASDLKNTKTVQITVQMKYTPAKLHIPKKPKIKNGKEVYDYYVYWTCENEKGEMVQHKDRSGINLIKDLRERKRKGLELVAAATLELKSGNNPAAKLKSHEVEFEKNKGDFYWWFEERLKYSKEKHSFYNWRKLNSVYNKVKFFRPNLKVSELTNKFLLDFEIYLIKEGNHTNTVADNLMRVKIIVNNIVRSGELEYHKNPFLQFKFKTKRVNKIRLTYKDIKKFEKSNLINENEILARDMYLMSFNVGGIRFGDICRLENRWFGTTHLDYVMHKTDMERHVKLNSSAKRLLEKYKNSGKYLFNTGVDWDSESESINKRNSFFRTKLRDACGKSGLPKINFHTSRNSLADLAKSVGHDSHTIKELLGLSKVATAERYMKHTYKEETEAAMDKMFGE